MVKTIVFVHGWASAPEIWQVQKEYFSKSYEVILPDISRAEDIKEASGIVYNAVQDKEDFVLLGWSLGWLVILELLQNQGLEPKGLICVNSTAKFIDSGNPGAGPTVVHLAKMMRDCKRNPQKTFEDFYKSILSGAGKSMLSNIRFKNLDYDKLIFGLYMLRDCDYRDFIQKIDLPALIIAGSGDSIAPLEASGYIHRKIRNSRIEILDCGHISFLDKADEFNAVLENFVKGL
jgi:pimeloyl-ACP methyl ester carboxylesterase